MDIDAKLRPLYLTQILKERTDEDHYLTTPQLCAILKDEYGGRKKGEVNCLAEECVCKEELQEALRRERNENGSQNQ